MKIRNGFVSNSSSSSFVMSVNNTPEDIKNALMHILSLTVSTTKEELMDDVYPDYEYNGGGYLFDEASKAIEDGKAILNFEVDWGDTTIYESLTNRKRMEELGVEYLGDLYS